MRAQRAEGRVLPPGRLRLTLVALGCFGAVVVPAALADGADAGRRDGSRADRAPYGARAAAPTAAKIRFQGAIHRLEPISSRHWPGSFAGVWLQGGDVVVAFTARPKRRLRLLRRGFPLKPGLPGGKRGFPQPGRLRTLKVERSLHQLETTEREMVADRTTGALGLDYDLDIDVRRNVPVATGPDLGPRETDWFKQRYGEHVVVRRGPVSIDFACSSRANCTPDLRSGLATSSPTATCSTAFAVTTRSSQVPSAILSAAHCGGGSDIGAVRRHHGVQYGQVLYERREGRVDAEVHWVNKGGFKANKALIFVNATEKAGSVNRVSLWSNVVIGQRICKAGQKTDYTCGEVTSKYHSPSPVPNSERFIKTTACAQPGDSGAGVFHEYRHHASAQIKRYEAMGILRGGAGDGSGAALPCSDPKFFMDFGHIEYVRSALPVAIRTEPVG